jgi:hypothetical protein
MGARIAIYEHSNDPRLAVNRLPRAALRGS